MVGTFTTGSRKLVLLLALALTLVLVLAGCGGNAKVDIREATATPSAEATQETSGSNNNGDEASKDVHSIQDAYGEVEIPVNPSKIVVLDIGALDNLLALGVKPIAAPSILAANDPYPSYLDGTEGIANIGTVNEPNLEAIDALKPDLIIGNKDTHDGIRAQLQQIAPVVFVETLGVTWKTNLKLHAEAVNKAAEGEELLKSYQAAADEIKGKLAEKGDVQVSLVRPRADKIQVYLQDTFAGSIMTDAGVARPASQSVEGFSKDITEEQIAELDGDVVLWFNREPDAFAKLEKSPLWGSLQAVQNNAVHPVEWEYWLSGLGIQAVNKVLGDLNTFLFEG